MTPQPTNAVNADYDVVHRPRHYNTHPSGVECVEYAELMPGNLSHVCVYVWHYRTKGSPVEDLQKAEWFLKREVDREPIEQTASRAYLGYSNGPSGGHTPESARILERLRALAPFIASGEFVATTVKHLLEYNLQAALELITEERLAVERGPVP